MVLKYDMEKFRLDVINERLKVDKLILFGFNANLLIGKIYVN